MQYSFFAPKGKKKHLEKATLLAKVSQIYKYFFSLSFCYWINHKFVKTDFLGFVQTISAD
jgi:hypothetical protein